MGSVGGIIARHEPDEAPIRRLFAAAPHRGDRVEVVHLGACVLGASHGPVADAGVAAAPGGAVAFSGCLDNLDQLAARPELRAALARVQSPAEAVLHTWLVHGERTPALLRGAYSVVATDGHDMWCWRDHLGFKTLFVRDEPDATYVASEAKQVLAAAGVPRRADLGVLELLYYGELRDQFPCSLDGVRRVPKATRARMRPGSASFTTYWEPRDLLETGRYDDAEIAERFDALMAQAVRRSLTGNDAVSLSGGIDSPAVAAYGAPEHLARYGRPLAALSVVYPEQPSVDETPYIEAVADALGMPLHRYRRSAQPLDGLEEWVQVLDGPVPKIFTSDAAEHYRKLSELGFRTMLTGEVAEFVIDRRGYVMAHLLLHGRLRAAARYVAACRAAGHRWMDIGKELGATLIPRPVSAAYRLVRLPYGAAPVPDFLDRSRFRTRYSDAALARRERWRQEQLWAFGGPGLTMEADDIVQAIHGVSVRRPWADVDLWEFFLSLPAEQKVPEPGRKKLVRRLLRGKVPDVILDRRDKTGFDESIVARIDYDALKRWLADPPFAMPGVDHDLLMQRLERRDLDAHDYMWAKDLAAVYAFVEGT